METMKAPFRTIYSNDLTNVLTCVSPYHKAEGPYRQEMLDATVDETAGRADVHMLEPALGWVPVWRSEIYPASEHYTWLRETYDADPDSIGDYLLSGGDMVADFIARCRHHSLVPFISFRLNDQHGKNFVDSERLDTSARWGTPLCFGRFYKEHPEYRLGPDLSDSNQRVHNWAIREAREFKFRLIEELCENYDFEGLQLDFMRHPSFFRLNETTVEERVAIMTEFVTRVRMVLDRTAKADEHRWLAVRIPCLLRLHPALGLDVESLERAGVEIFNLSAYYFTIQHTEVAAIREKIPDSTVYFEMTHCLARGDAIGKGGDNTTNRRVSDEQFYTSAHLAYAGKVDGISLFNFVYYREHGVPGRGPFHEPPFHVVNRLGDPPWLARQRQHYFLAKSWESPLPAIANPGRPLVFNLDMAPPADGWQGNGRLRMQTTYYAPGDLWSACLNGEALEESEDVSQPYRNPYPHLLGDPEQWQAWVVPAHLLRRGKNEVRITLLSGEPDSIIYLDLVIG